MRLALVVSRYHNSINQGLERGAREYLREINLEIDEVFPSPGSFEIPVICRALIATQRFDGIIALGCVVQGETAHFENINLSVSQALMQISLESLTPVAFGILTTYSMEQAWARSGGDIHNRGREAARACVEMVSLLSRIRISSPNSPPSEDHP